MSGSAYNSQNVPVIVPVSLGSLTADGVIHAVQVPQKFVVTAFKVVNAANIAASNTDFALLQLKAGSTVLAQYDTRAAGQGALTANVAKSGALTGAVATPGFSLPAVVVAKGTDLTVVYDETDSGTAIALTLGKAYIEGYWL